MDKALILWIELVLFLAVFLIGMVLVAGLYYFFFFSLITREKGVYREDSWLMYTRTGIPERVLGQTNKKKRKQIIIRRHTTRQYAHLFFCFSHCLEVVFSILVGG